MPASSHHRRAFLLSVTALAGVGLAAAAVYRRGISMAVADNVTSSVANTQIAAAQTGGTVLIAAVAADGTVQAAAPIAKVVKSDDEWQKQLPPDSYEVARQAGTEAPFTGALLNEHREGVFNCICCNTALYSSKTKFESGTGWPSFWQPIAKENVTLINDTSLGMQRTAVSCTRCDAHLGHVFDDGPQPTGLRFCMNSVAMTFTAKA